MNFTKILIIKSLIVQSSLIFHCWENTVALEYIIFPANDNFLEPLKLFWCNWFSDDLKSSASDTPFKIKHY
jgi:hypothetical protein